MLKHLKKSNLCCLKSLVVKLLNQSSMYGNQNAWKKKTGVNDCPKYILQSSKKKVKLI